MKREIKFRAWYPKTKTMVDDALMLSEKGQLILVSEKHLSIPFSILNECKWMQFTGLTDKYGQEIYEGDIIMYGSMKIIIDLKKQSVTKYGHGDSTTNLYVGYSLSQYGKSVNLNEIEKIGNIYQNSEIS